MFHNDPHRPNSQIQQQQHFGHLGQLPPSHNLPSMMMGNRPKSAPSTPIKKQTASPELILVNAQTPSPKHLSQHAHAQQSRPKSTNAVLDHNPHVRNKKKSVIVSPNFMMSPQAGVSLNNTASIQLDSQMVGKLMGKILMKKQSIKETPLGNKGRKQPNILKEETFDRVKKQLMFDDETTILPKKISPPRPAVQANLNTPNVNINNFIDSTPRLDIAEPKIEIEERIFDYDDDTLDNDMEGREDMMDLLVLRKKMKSEETA